MSAPTIDIPKTVDTGFWKKWRYQDTLGTGASGRVVDIRDRVTGAAYALKLFKPTHVQHAVDVELPIMFYLNSECKRLLKFREFVYIPDPQSMQPVYGLRMDLAAGSDLFQFGQTYPDPLGNFHTQESMKLFLQRLVWDVSRQLRCVHRKRFAHRDIKLENITYSQTVGRHNRTRHRFQLIDFGLSTSVDTPTAHDARVGTLNYMAPEMIQNRVLDPRIADIWSLGVTAWEAATGSQFVELEGVRSQRDALYELSQSMHAVQVQEFYPASPELENLIRQMLQWDPQKRPTASEILDRVNQIRIAQPIAPPRLALCHNCPTQTDQQCTRCGTPYCSIRCQRADWRDHRALCK